MEFKDIVSDWQRQFPVLSSYTPPTLVAKAGCVLIGLRLDKDRFGAAEYSVYLEILPLWVPEKEVINAIFMLGLLNKKGMQFSIANTWHDSKLSDYVHRQRMRGITDIDHNKMKQERQYRLSIVDRAFECAHQQFGTVLQENVNLSDLFRLINSAPIRGAKHNPLYWSRIFELELALACYFKRTDLVNGVKADVDKETRHWDKKWFNDLFHKSVDEWKKELYERMNDKEAFMQQVELNLNSKRIFKLKPINIVDDVRNYNDIKPHTPIFERLKRIFKN